MARRISLGVFLVTARKGRGKGRREKGKKGKREKKKENM